MNDLTDPPDSAGNHRPSPPIASRSGLDAVPAAARRFPMRLQGAFRLPLLLLLGVRAGTAGVRIEDGVLSARFGWYSLQAPLADVVAWDITGPYRWWMAIGLRRTLGRQDTTFGGSAHGGVCIHLREAVPVRFFGTARFLATTELYVTVADLAGLGAELERLGIPGQDGRATR